MRRTLSYVLAGFFLFSFHGANRASADALAKMTADKLEAVHKAVEALTTQRQEPPRSGPYKDFRANLHVHSLLSHDSRGTVDEIVAAAKSVGTKVLMFTEHPADRYDYFKDGHRGLRDGVLLIPGAETGGFLVFPTRSLQGLPTGSSQEFADLVRSHGGLIFLSHLEERMDWDIRGLTGNEIYNIHADFKDEKKLLAAMRSPLWIVKTADLIRRYPQEAFSALQDYPADYLKRWDELCQKSPHTGVAANDSHQNVGLVIKAAADNKIALEDALGEKLTELDAGSLPLLAPLRKGKKVGDILFQARLDPYANSLRHVGTHLLLTELSDKAVWEALEAGRAFVAFDWLADATGFDFALEAGQHRHEMGSRVKFEKGMRLAAKAPLAVGWRLLRDGKVISESSGRSLEAPVDQPGIYRVEAWLDIAGEKMIWILSNPIYVRAGS